MLCGIYLESNRPTLDISLRHPTRLICGSLVVCAPYLASLEAQSIPLRSNQLCGGVFNLKACSVEFIWSQIALPSTSPFDTLPGSFAGPSLLVCAPYLAPLEAQSIPLKSNQLCKGVFNLKACSVEFIWSQIALPSTSPFDTLPGSFAGPWSCVYRIWRHSKLKASR
jgi:hypothetical protein